MKRAITSLSLTAFLLCSCARGAGPVAPCRDRTNHESGIIISACGYDAQISEALDFLGAKEPGLYKLASACIRRISWEGNPFWSLSRYPGTVSLSTYSFRRGKIFLASLIVHELSHIVAWKIRSGNPSGGEIAAVIAAYRSLDTGPGVISIAHMEPYPQEEAIHRLQLSFLVKHRDTAGAELQRDILRELPRTYRHLRSP
jgi:hypothetical protein